MCNGISHFAQVKMFGHLVRTSSIEVAEPEVFHLDLQLMYPQLNSNVSLECCLPLIYVVNSSM